MRMGNAKLIDEMAKLKKQIREQNAADLLLNALEAVGIIKKDPPKPFSDYQLIHKQRLAGTQSQGLSYDHGLGQISTLLGF